MDSLKALIKLRLKNVGWIIDKWQILDYFLKLKMIWNLFGDTAQRSGGVEQANSYIDGLLNIFQLLFENPLMCREREEFIPPVHIHPHAHHLIIYSVGKRHRYRARSVWVNGY